MVDLDQLITRIDTQLAMLRNKRERYSVSIKNLEDLRELVKDKNCYKTAILLNDWNILIRDIKD